MKQTYTLSNDDLKEAVALFLNNRYKAQVEPKDVKINIKPGYQGDRPWESSTLPSVEASATVETK